MAEVDEMYSWKHSSRPEAVWRGGRAGRRCRRVGGPSWPVQEKGVDVLCGVERAQAHQVKLQYFRDAALAEAGECRGGVVSSE